MPRRLFHPWARLGCLVAIGCGWLLGALSAAELAVSAQLSSSSTGLGEPVQLQIKVAGARSATLAPAVVVEGLRIDYLGPSQSTSMRIENGNVVSETSVTYIYQVEPKRTGNFTIPPVSIPVEGRTLQTRAVGLKVEDAGTRSAQGVSPVGILEVVLPKKTAYVGEMVPVEIRLSVDAGVRWQPEAMPTIPGEGFTKQKLPEPRQERGSRNGREVDVLVFRTAITPSKAGKITLGPVELPYVAQVPRAQPRRPRSFFDDIFGDSSFAVNQRYRAHADAVELEVKPLPVTGRPENFSGAVGQFRFSGTGAPNRVKIGDPITMTLTVSGRGNFDRTEAPALRDSTGWRSYPASAAFKGDDDLGLSGTKTFSMAVIPEEKKSAMPVFEFVYFDPAAEKYVTLSSELGQLVVEGGEPPPAAVAAVPVEPSVKPPTAPEAAAAKDILGIRYEAGRSRHSFVPWYARREFLFAQAVPATALLALLFFKLRRDDAGARRSAAWRRERAELVARLRRSGLPEQEFLDAAARVVQLDTALATGRPAESVDAAAARASRQLEPETAAGLEQIFSVRAELLYAGNGGGRGGLSADERREVLATLDRFERSPLRG